MKICTSCDSKFAETVQFCPRCGQVLVDDSQALVGRVLDGTYKIESLLGTGGMGAVYKARHLRLDDMVAIKILKREMSTDSSWLKRFQREGQAARKFRHPNCVTVHDLRTTEDGLAYLVLEFIEGRDLRAELSNRGALSPREAVELLDPVASVLDAAHANGVVHRDLKPENVMVADDGRGGRLVKVLDLGIAKLRSSEPDASTTNLTVVGQLMGTPHYMSPEQWGEIPRDGSSEIDGRADVYSLGVMAYEFVTGTWPFTATTLQEWRREHVTSSARPTHALRSGIPEAFSQAINRAMAKDRGDRFQTAGEFLQALRASLIGVPTADPAGTQQQRPASTSEAIDYAATIPNPAGGRATVPDNYTTFGDRAASQGATLAEAAHPPTQVTPGQPFESPAGAKASGGSRLALAAGAVLVTAAIATGGIYFVRNMSKPESPPQVANANTAPAPAPAPQTYQVMKYFLEAEFSSGDTAQLTAQEPLVDVVQYRLHFFPSEPGYLYIIGPDQNNDPALYYATPPDQPLAADRDLVFPEEGWLEPILNVTHDQATIIFSKKPIEDPAFFDNPGATLTPADRKALAALRSRFKPPESLVNPAQSGGEKSMLVRTTQPGEPAVFDIVVKYAPGT